MHYIIGLGNPGSEYEFSRHNAGRMVLDVLHKTFDFEEWKENKSVKAEVAKGEIDGAPATLIFPETFMNKSGLAAAKFVTSAKKAEKTIVIYDEIDLPLGTIRIAFGRGSGGHRGIESMIRSLKTKDFVRIRVGVCPTTPTGKLKKPKGEQKVVDLLLGDFKKPELDILKKEFKQIAKAVSMIVHEGRAKAMGEFN